MAPRSAIDPEEITLAVHKLYSSLSFRPPEGHYTIISSFCLSHAPSQSVKVISLGTGSKCLPFIRLPLNGDALHDSHAEVLARRGSIYWFYEEINRLYSGSGSKWIKTGSDGMIELVDSVNVHLYVSTVPCGDASMRFLASYQDEDIAALKNSTVFPTPSPNTASRGRNNYSLLGVLRTKPGRADSPPTISMSCSDKIASWNALGFQGALAAHFMRPFYIKSIIIGGVEVDMQGVVAEDCQRAFWKRIGTLGDDIPPEFSIHEPTVHFTSTPFIHARPSPLGSPVKDLCNDSLCWIADSLRPHDVLINGLKRGLSPKHRQNEKFRPQLSKLSMFNLYIQNLTYFNFPLHPEEETYYEAKQSITHYQRAKHALMGENGPFSGWVRSSAQWESFDSKGRYQSEQT